MALILLGPAVADIRGSVGGSTFARNSSGNYIRNRTKPVYPASDAQVLAAANMSANVAAWNNDLTVAQRVLWNALALRTNRRNALGQSITVSGFNLYIRSNMMLLLTGQPAVTAPPTNPEVPAPAFTLDHLAADGVRVTGIGAWDNSAAGSVYSSFSPNLRQTINFHKGPFINPSTTAFAAYGALPRGIYASANLAIDTRVYVYSVAVHADGGCSAPVVYRQDIGDPV